MEKVLLKHLIANDFHASESIKALRANLLFAGQDMRVIGLTSYRAEEGKSTISLQLAVSMAQADKQVLLLDADLRRSSLLKQMRVKGRPKGLTHYLSGQVDAKDVLCETDIPGLYILFAGSRVPNSAELLGNENFKKLIPALKESFDYVIVDTAPLGQIIDCAVMANSLDGVILVVDAMRNSYKLLRRVLAQLEKSGGKVLGVVLNRVDFQTRRGYYGSYYKYKYGYDSNSSKEKK